MLRNAQLMTTLTATLFTLSLGLPALAKTSYPNHIPNGGVNSCATCHVSPYGVERAQLSEMTFDRLYREVFQT